MTVVKASLLMAGLVPACSASLSLERALLDRSNQPSVLEKAGIALASSADPEDVSYLAARLGDAAFLRRLDSRSSTSAGMLRLQRIFTALAEHPSPATAALCMRLADDAEYTAVPARLNLLLTALAAVRPMSASAAAVFRSRARSGFLETAGPLLAGNASPHALDALAELLRDEYLHTAQRVNVAHYAILPNRTKSDVVTMCSRVLEADALARDVRIGVLESLFDYQPRLWFGRRSSQPVPPPWTAAPRTARDGLQAVGGEALRRADLPAHLRAAIETALQQLRNVAIGQ